MAKIVVLYAASKNQVIVRDVAEIGNDGFVLNINTFHDPLEDGDVLIVGQHVSERCGNIALSQSGHSHLIKEWLKQVIVFSVDEVDLDIGFISQNPGGIEPCKSAAYNYNPLFHFQCHFYKILELFTHSLFRKITG